MGSGDVGGGAIHSGGCGGPQWWYGEASMYTIHIPCVVYTQAFLLDGDSIKHIMQLYPVVEERLWRVSGIRTAMHLLPQLPEYQVRDGVCVCACVGGVSAWCECALIYETRW